MIIAIDGPTASGKSTLARLLADKLNIYYLSTGLLYRALAYILTHDFGYSEKDLYTPKIEDLIVSIDHANLKYEYSSDKGPIVIYKGRDITSHLKTAEMDRLASIIATNPMVRSQFVNYQRELAHHQDLVVEGRDIGSVVFPNAEIKIFLTATIEERAKRWQKYQEEKGIHYSLEDAVAKITQRDERDMTRKISPLIVAQGAITVDDTNLTEEETLQKILEIVQKYRASLL